MSVGFHYKYDEPTRATIDSIVNRLESDPGFQQRVTTDPRGVLREAGLPDEAIDDYLRASTSDDEVAGYMRQSYTIGGCKCWDDGRPDTCYAE